MRRLPPLLCALAFVLAVAGCGNDPVDTRDPLTIQKPERLVVKQYKNAGMKFRAPDGWRSPPGKLPRVVTFSSGEAVLAVFAYRRKEPSPPDKEALGRARKRLVRQARRRDKRFKLRKERNTRVAGRPAIEITGTQTIGGLTLETRSVHVFKSGAEYVIEALAPRRQYKLLNTWVVAPLLKSLTVTGKVKRPPAPRKPKAKPKRQAPQRSGSAAREIGQDAAGEGQQGAER